MKKNRHIQTVCLIFTSLFALSISLGGCQQSSVEHITPTTLTSFIPSDNTQDLGGYAPQTKYSTLVGSNTITTLDSMGGTELPMDNMKLLISNSPVRFSDVDSDANLIYGFTTSTNSDSMELSGASIVFSAAKPEDFLKLYSRVKEILESQYGTLTEGSDIQLGDNNSTIKQYTVLSNDVLIKLGYYTTPSTEYPLLSSLQGQYSLAISVTYTKFPENPFYRTVILLLLFSLIIAIVVCVILSKSNQKKKNKNLQLMAAQERHMEDSPEKKLSTETPHE